VQVDWVTVAAQVVNFLILVGLLHRFLYGPIMRAMAEREARIAERLRSAGEQAEAAESEAAEYRRKRAELERDRQRLLAEAREESARLQRALEEGVREEVEATRRGWIEELERERASWRRDVRREVAERFTALARQALRDLADADLEVQIVTSFTERLRRLPDDRRQRLAEAVAAAGDHVTVVTAFGLSGAARDELARAVRESVAAGARLSYGRSDDLACGIELRAGGETVRWSLESYLDAFQTELEAALGDLSPHGEGGAGR
jgi:F-type H+-transporting ATPase subunit b